MCRDEPSCIRVSGLLFTSPACQCTRKRGPDGSISLPADTRKPNCSEEPCTGLFPFGSSGGISASNWAPTSPYHQRSLFRCASVMRWCGSDLHLSLSVVLLTQRLLLVLLADLPTSSYEHCPEAGGYGVMQLMHSDPVRLESFCEAQPAKSAVSLLSHRPSQVCECGCVFSL